MIRDERRVRSRLALPLTASQRRANEKLARLLELRGIGGREDARR
jgi:hypothetical protein